MYKPPQKTQQHTHLFTDDDQSQINCTSGRYLYHWIKNVLAGNKNERFVLIYQITQMMAKLLLESFLCLTASELDNEHEAD